MPALFICLFKQQKPILENPNLQILQIVMLIRRLVLQKKWEEINEELKLWIKSIHNQTRLAGYRKLRIRGSQEIIYILIVQPVLSIFSGRLKVIHLTSTLQSLDQTDTTTQYYKIQSYVEIKVGQIAHFKQIRSLIFTSHLIFLKSRSQGQTYVFQAIILLLSYLKLCKNILELWSYNYLFMKQQQQQEIPSQNQQKRVPGYLHKYQAGYPDKKSVFRDACRQDLHFQSLTQFQFLLNLDKQEQQKLKVQKEIIMQRRLPRAAPEYLTPTQKTQSQQSQEPKISLFSTIFEFGQPGSRAQKTQHQVQGDLLPNEKNLFEVQKKEQQFLFNSSLKEKIGGSIQREEAIFQKWLNAKDLLSLQLESSDKSQLNSKTIQGEDNVIIQEFKQQNRMQKQNKQRSWKQGFLYHSLKFQEFDVQTQDQENQQPRKTQNKIEQLLQQTVKKILRNSLKSLKESKCLPPSAEYHRFAKYITRKEQKCLSEQLVDQICGKFRKQIIQLTNQATLIQETATLIQESNCLAGNQIQKQVKNLAASKLDLSLQQNWNPQAYHLQKQLFIYETNMHIDRINSIVQAMSANEQQSIMKNFTIREQFTEQDYIRCTGLLQSIWYDRFGRVEMVGYSTGFAISQRIIVGCAHSIYQKRKNRVCDKIYFVPFHGDSSYTTKQHIYQSQDQNFLRFQPLRSTQRYGSKPLKKDYAVFIIKETKPFLNKCYLRLSCQELAQKQALKIWGYPSKQYAITTPLLGTDFKRVDLSGYFCKKKKDHILVHNMHTLGGHSGSPIVRLTDKNNKPSIRVVGIHTHRGTGDTNQGLSMTKELKTKIMRSSKQLCQDHNLNYLEQFPYQKSTDSRNSSEM